MLCYDIHVMSKNDTIKRPIMLFDVMDTIVHDPFFHEIPAFWGMTSSQLMPLLSEESWDLFEKNLMDEQTFATHFFKDNRSYDFNTLKQLMIDAYRFIPGMENLLTQLTKNNYEIHALSNYPCWYQHIENKLTLSRFLSWTFVSCNIGIRKPDKALYHHVLNHLNIPPEDLLFIDDRQINTDAAASVGFDTITYQSIDHLYEELNKRNIITSFVKS